MPSNLTRAVGRACLGLLALASPAAADTATDDRAVFEARCAMCHGSDGRGEPGRASFDLPLPDFTDCAFASREADADWLAVIRSGGPARGFSAVMPAHGQALSGAEIAAALRHLRSFCRDTRWPPGELNLPRALVTEKAFPEDEALVESFVDTNRDGRVITSFVFEKRIGPRSQVEIALPFAAVEDPERPGSWRGGLGDVALAMKHAFFHSGERGTIAAVGAEVLLPTGDEDRGLGTGTTVFEPYLAVGQTLPGGAFVQLQALGELPVDRSRDDEVQLRAALGRTWRVGRFGRAVSPMLEAVGTWAFAPDGVAEQWELVPQVQIALSRRQHVRLNVGARVPVTDTGVRPVRFGIYLLWDWFDGGLLEGW